MAYPERPWWLPTKLELAFGADPADPSTWEWTDVSADLDRTQQIQIRRGRPNEAGQPSPASTSPRLVNNGGDYTPGHPLGTHYPLVRQGVPARISVQAGGPYLLLPDTPGARARVASTPALDITGDLDVRVEVALDTLPAQATLDTVGASPFTAVDSNLIGRYDRSTNQRAWRLTMRQTGAPLLGWSPDGVAFTEYAATEAVPYVSGQRFAVRAALDIDDGAGGHVVTFWIASTMAGPWHQLGESFRGAGVTSIYVPTSVDLVVGAMQPELARGAGRWYKAEVRRGIGGDVVASPDFTTQAIGTTSFTDAAGRTWLVEGAAGFTDWRRRMVGTVDDWAPTWPYGDLSQGDYVGEARTDITISGILRRLGQGQQPLQSTLRRRVPSASPMPVAYWPMEDGRAATAAASALPGAQPLTLTDVSWAADDSLGGSAPLPTLGQQGRLHGRVTGARSGGWQAEMVYHLETMPATEQTMLTLSLSGASGGVTSVRVRCSTGGIRVQALDSEDNVVAFGLFTDPGAIAAWTAGWNRLVMFSYQSGASCYVRAGWRNITDNTYWYAGTIWTGTTVGRVTAVTGAWGADFQGMPIGHLAVWDVGGASLTAPGVRVYDGADDGYAGETAIARMRRLAQEEALPFSVLGLSTESPQMGSQGQATLLDLIQECVDVDGGILSERRETTGLQYRPRYLLYNQRPALQLSARSNEIDAPFAPVLDDQRLRNLIQVTRRDGSSATADDPDSIAEHGLYDDGVTLNVATDDQLPGIAAWRLYRGTWQGMRYPAVTTALDLAPQTIDDWLDRVEGDRVLVGDLPPQHPTDTVDLLTEGTTETLTPTGWSIEANASPGGVWTVGEIGHDDPSQDAAPCHVDTDGSQLAAAISPTDTSLIVQTMVGQVWATTAGPSITAATGDYPVDVRVGGEVMTAQSAEPLVWDTFTRTVSNGWGTTESGSLWTSSGGPASDRSVNGSAGVLTLSAPVTTVRFQLPSWQVTDPEVLTSITPSVVATGAPFLTGVALRISGSSWYWARLVLGVGGSVGIELALGLAPLTSLVTMPYTYSAGTRLWVRARVTGQLLQARVWPAGRPEPSVWNVETTVTTGTIASGFIGVLATGSVGNTNTNPAISYDDFALVNPQRMAVVRSVNGISKSHSTGTDLRLANPMIIAL